MINDETSGIPYSRTVGYASLISAYILGCASLMMWLAFVFHGGFNIVRLKGLDEIRLLLFDACLSVIFFAQHSVMARSAFQKRLSRYVHPDLHGAVFTICTGIPLLAATLLWQKTDQTIVSINSISRTIMHLVFFLGFAGFHWGVKSLGTFDIFGVGPITRRLKNETPPPSLPFTVRGPYCYVRHPLYLGTLMMIWSCPNLTTDRLMHNVLWTAWIVVGSILEERELRKTFGENYSDYQKKVPMLLPRRFTGYSPSPD